MLGTLQIVKNFREFLNSFFTVSYLFVLFISALKISILTRIWEGCCIPVPPLPVYMGLGYIPELHRKVSKYGVFSGPHFRAFGLNTEIYGVKLRIKSKCGKIRTRKSSVFRQFSRSDPHWLFIKLKAFYSLNFIVLFGEVILRSLVAFGWTLISSYLLHSINC